MELQKDKFPDHTLPWVIEALTDAVLKLNGPQTEGIFRYQSTVILTSVFTQNRKSGNFHIKNNSHKIFLWWCTFVVHSIHNGLKVDGCNVNKHLECS